MLSLVVMYEPTTAISTSFNSFIVLSLMPPSTSSKIFLSFIKFFISFYSSGTVFLEMVALLDQAPLSLLILNQYHLGMVLIYLYQYLA